MREAACLFCKIGVLISPFREEPCVSASACLNNCHVFVLLSESSHRGWLASWTNVEGGSLKDDFFFFFLRPDHFWAVNGQHG